ncbi:hypothetical protein [Roseburia sp. AM59-24XD]|jgi:hypothetical protein|uniref:hypothetical protein n=1 Tax=Roseburia sp. AM59-24XD TaxID=2293138 RepID=UPI0011C396F1|nr:hypothetical protein [Roseburia sp. AM59-24XD]
MRVSGYCPTQGKNYSIDVSYIDASTFDGKQFIKGQAYCNYTAQCNPCNRSNDCPIYKNAPETHE